MPVNRDPSTGRYTSGGGGSNSVGIRFFAIDNLSGSIRSMKSNISSSITSAIAKVAALTAATAISAAAFGNLGSGMSTAMSMQTQQISTAYGLATVLGTTVSDAKNSTKELTKAINEMGDTLPGATEDYSKFANALSTTVAFGAKGDMSKYKKDVTEASKYGGLLAATSGADTTQGAGALNKFLSGGMSQAEAFNTSDIFQKNQDFKVYMNAAQKQMGLDGKDFQKQLTNAQRIAVFSLAGSMKFTPEMIAAFGDTADTQLQAIKSKLFNPVTGIFGFLREVKGLDGRTALDSVSTLLKQVGLLGTSAAVWLSKAGISLDPMEFIGKAVDRASAWANAFSAALAGDGSGLEMMLTSLRKTLLDAPKMLASGLNNLLSGMSRVLKNVDPKQVGAFFSELINNITDSFKSIKVTDITNALNWGVSSASEAIKGVNWTSVGTSLGEGITKAAANFDWVAAGKMLDDARWGVFKALAGGISGVVKNGIVNPLQGINKDINKATGGYLGGDGKTKNGFQKDLDRVGTSIVGEPDSPKKIENERKLNDMIIQQRLKEAKGDQSALPSLGQLSASASSSSVYAPVVNLSGSATQEQADYLLTELNRQFLQYRDGALA